MAGCTKTYTSQFNLGVHFRSVHTTMALPCTVANCNRQFSHRCSLERHLRWHGIAKSPLAPGDTALELTPATSPATVIAGGNGQCSAAATLTGIPSIPQSSRRKRKRMDDQCDKRDSPGLDRCDLALAAMDSSERSMVADASAMLVTTALKGDTLPIVARERVSVLVPNGLPSTWEYNQRYGDGYGAAEDGSARRIWSDAIGEHGGEAEDEPLSMMSAVRMYRTPA